MKSIARRAPAVSGVWRQSVPEVIRRIYAARGIVHEDDTLLAADRLHPTSAMGGIDQAVARILTAIDQHQSIIISGDYDCDGATATTVAVRGLRLLGASRVSFTIPDRFKHGYGLTPALIDDLSDHPDLIITVDSGVASHAGVSHAAALGIDVVITDHHLPGDTLPAEAIAIVNPNLKGDTFPSKALAGVGVMFYLLVAVRKAMVDRGQMRPPLGELLDIVALGTVADLVPLDTNNRILVAAGLQRIRQGKAHAGLKALMELTGKDPERLCAQDFGFAIGPRINAAGRLENMRLGVELLLCDRMEEARELAKQLDGINKDRQALQATMMEEAQSLLDEASGQVDDRIGITVHAPSWHAGVVGLVASKLKESLHRPVFAFAPGEGDDPFLRGSGRSIEGFHLRDALALMDSKRPGLIGKFGGHAMAAGLSLDQAHLEEFAQLFDTIARETLQEDQLQAVVLTDGELSPEDISLELAQWIAWAGPWGQAFPLPCFDNVFELVASYRLSGNHVKLLVRDPRSQREYDALYFGGYQEEAYPRYLRIAYELNENVWRDNVRLQLMVKTLEASPLPLC